MLGAVVTPTFVRGLSLTVDHFKIKINDAIGSLDGDEPLRECYGRPQATPRLSPTSEPHGTNMRRRRRPSSK